MLIKVQYNDETDRAEIIDLHSDMFLIEEQNLVDGNFLIFSDERPEPPIVYVSVPQEEFDSLKQENQLLRAQNNALSERADFIEDVVAEMATQIYQ